jgi:transcriptional regulator MraZ
MFRGSAPAKIDEKGRLKVPTDFRRFLEERYGPDLFVTSILGDSALIYPLAVWEEIEQRLAATLDTQGRLLVPQLLRESAGMNGEVVVTAQLDHLVVWNHERFLKRLAEEPFTEDDFRALAERGI